MSALGEVAGVKLVPVHPGRGRGGEAGGQEVQAVQHLLRHRQRGEAGQQLEEHLVIPATGDTDGTEGGVHLPQAPEMAVQHTFTIRRSKGIPGVFFVDLVGNNED